MFPHGPAHHINDLYGQLARLVKVELQLGLPVRRIWYHCGILQSCNILNRYGPADGYRSVYRIKCFYFYTVLVNDLRKIEAEVYGTTNSNAAMVPWPLLF